jgi:hypothetical protein
VELAFLGEVQYGACHIFSTVLAPGSDRYHHDHIHLDLAHRASGRSYCKPAAVMPPPPEPPLLGGWQMVQAPAAALPPGAAMPAGALARPGAAPALLPDPPPLAGFGPPGSIGTAETVALPPGPRPRAPIPLGYAE